MRRFRFALLLLLAFGFAASPLLAKDEEPLTPNEEAEEFAKTFKKGYKKLPESEMLASIDKIVAYYQKPEVDDKKVRKALVDAMGKASTVRDTVIVAHVMKQCGNMGTDAVKVILPTLARELKKKVPEDRVYGAALESLGKLHAEDRTSVKALTDLLKNKDDAIVARAAFAIAGYKAASGNTRKTLFEEVLKQSEGTYSSSQAQNENAKRKWTIIGDDVMEALNVLASPPRPEGQAFENPPAARSWFNDNKKKPWDRRE